MRTSSCKAKGRRLAQEIRDALLQTFPELEAGDITVTPSGVTGPDLIVSPLAKKTLGFYAECKNQESISIWECLLQAGSYTVGDHQGVLFFRRNRTPTHVGLSLPFFLKLLRNSYEHGKAKADSQDHHVRGVQQPTLETKHSQPLRSNEVFSSDTGITPVRISERLGDEP